jgi:hypothetical protein
MNKITKVSDKLFKVGESFTVHMYDNGFMIEANGRNSEDNWETAKVLCSTEDELIALVHDAINIKRDSQ